MLNAAPTQLFGHTGANRNMLGTASKMVARSAGFSFHAMKGVHSKGDVLGI